MLVALLIIFIVLFVIAAFLALCFLFALVKSQKDLRNSRYGYLALQTGMDEQQESFEAEWLAWKDLETSLMATNSGLHSDIKLLTHISEHHADNCIPDYSPILTLESYDVLVRHCEMPSKYYDRVTELEREQEKHVL